MVGAVVAYLGVGENDDLAGVGGVGSYFMVSGMLCIKNDFALAFAGMAIAVAEEDAPIFER